MDISQKQAFLKASGYFEGDFSGVLQPSNDLEVLSLFLQGKDSPTYGRMMVFFSGPGKYLHPRELMRFRDSLTDEEWADFKVEFWSHMDATNRINEVHRLLTSSYYTIEEVSETMGISVETIKTMLED
jgi:hypothetical protein